jgi:hypothetical protein
MVFSAALEKSDDDEIELQRLPSERRMAEIFEKKERSRTAPMKPGEGIFPFYDSSARPEYDTYRDLLNRWLSEMPDGDQAEMVARFRTGTDLQYQAALSELTIHAAMKRQGYAIELHPACGHPTRKPDFRAKRGDTQDIVVEVTTFTPGVPEVSQSKRDADIYNALDKTKLPAGWRFGFDIVDHGDKPTSLNKIRSDAEKWANEVAGEDPMLVRNPWADHPLPDEFLPLPGFKHVKDAYYSPTEGTALADILELPAVWPPAEQE